MLFADIKDSTELITDLDPEEAQKLLDPAIHLMMDAVHRFEGTVNQVLGDGIMVIFGAPLAHEDHALRACYAALAMQTAMQPHAGVVRRSHGIDMQMRVGLNSGEVVVRTIGNDLHMDYSAVGPTTHLAARMEQVARPGIIRFSGSTLRLVEGLVQVTALGPIPVKGMTVPVEVYELTGASAIRRRLQAAVARGLTTFVGRETEITALQHALEQAGAGRGQVVAAVGEAGVGKSRLVYEFVHSPHTQGWRVLESASVSYGKATPYFPVMDLLKWYVHVEEGDDPRTMRAKVTGHIFTLDASLQETIPALLSLLNVLPEDSPFLTLDPPQRRQRTLDGLKRIFLRESQVQPLLLVFEDLHWIDSETQALLDSLVEHVPTAPLLLLVNYRPEYHHAWGSKTFYTQLRLDPLPPERADEFLATLLGNDPSLEPLKKLLIERTEGNPFFLEESVRTLVETQVFVGEQDAYRLEQELPAIQVPATVQAVLAARIDRLPQTEKQLVQTAAVIGTEVPFVLLQAIAEMSEEALHQGLTHLQAAEFLYETSLFPERVYTFKHALCLRYGAPQHLISDSGGAFTSNDVTAVLQRLQIVPNPLLSTQGESYKNLMETYFNIQRRLCDYQFSLTTTPAEFEQVHQTFMETYNTTAHEGLLKDGLHPPVPLQVLGQAKGRLYTPEELARRFSRALFPRTTNQYGCVTLHSYHFYVEAGLPKTRVLLWVYGEQLRAVLDHVVLAEYRCRYDWRDHHVKEIHDGVFYPTRFASPQSTLIPLTPHESLIVYRPKPTGRLGQRLVSVQQLWLFELVQIA